MNKLFAAPVAALVVALLAGCAGTNVASAPTVTVTAPAPPAANKVTVPNLVGKDGAAARDKLKDVGLEHEFDAGEDSVIIASNWDVESQSPKAGSKAASGSTVTLSVVKPTPSAEAEDSADNSGPSKTKSGLTFGAAAVACNHYGDAQYPYGFKASWILDGTNEIIGDSYSLVAGGKVTNGFNATAKVTVQCIVSGTENAPKVTAFAAN